MFAQRTMVLACHYSDTSIQCALRYEAGKEHAEIELYPRSITYQFNLCLVRVWVHFLNMAICVSKMPMLWAWISTLIIGLSDTESGWRRVSFFTARDMMWQIEYAFT